MSNSVTVRKAVFPIAGLGTRFLPATKASPKEMLPVVDKPLFQYAVEEAYEAGIRHMIFVTGRTKRSVEDHFDTAYELESELERSGKSQLLQLARSIAPQDMVCSYVRQQKALGLGHAVLCARELVGNEAFAILLADDLMVGSPSVTAQLVERFKECHRSVIGVVDVPREHTDRYGIVTPKRADGEFAEIAGIVEKPLPETAPGTLAVGGRYIFTPSLFNQLAVTSQGVGGEIQLTDAIAGLLITEPVYAYRFAGRRFDCGSKLGFIQATVTLGKLHPEIGEAFSDWLERQA